MISYTATKIDVDDIAEIYTAMSKLIYDDMDKQYKEGKISGPTYSDTWAKLMSSVIDGSLKSVTALINNETDHDRLVKESTANLNDTKAQNETCVAQSTCAKNEAETLLINAKKKAEDIKNADLTVPNSLYGHNIAMVTAQEALYTRQKDGFDDNANQKYLDSITGPYSILFQDLDLTSGSLPTAFTGPGVDAAVKRVTDGLDTF